jgi:outer membrane protein OmpU
MLSSISLFASANAGEISVSGSAKATYNIQSGKTNAGKGLGITNELNFTASGELDNGYTWSYSMELDPADATDTGAANNDDTKLTLTTPYGTFGVFVSEGALDVEDGASQSVYARPTDVGDPSSGSGDNYTIDGYNSLQYHTASGMLPFGTVIKIGYAPDLDSTINSGNDKGQTIARTAAGEGRSMMAYQVSATPIDGLTIGASYNEFNDAGLAKNDQDPESGAAYVKYATGPFSIGYSEARKAMLLADNIAATAVEGYEQKNYSVAYAATDNLSISYEVEEDRRQNVTATTADVDQESSSIQAAYSIGGATISAVMGKYDNVGWDTTKSIDQFLLAITMAF